MSHVNFKFSLLLWIWLGHCHLMDWRWDGLIAVVGLCTELTFSKKMILQFKSDGSWDLRQARYSASFEELGYDF